MHCSMEACSSWPSVNLWISGKHNVWWFWFLFLRLSVLTYISGKASGLDYFFFNNARKFFTQGKLKLFLPPKKWFDSFLGWVSEWCLSVFHMEASVDSLHAVGSILILWQAREGITYTQVCKWYMYHWPERCTHEILLGGWIASGGHDYLLCCEQSPILFYWCKLASL